MADALPARLNGIEPVPPASWLGILVSFLRRSARAMLLATRKWAIRVQAGPAAFIALRVSPTMQGARTMGTSGESGNGEADIRRMDLA